MRETRMLKFLANLDRRIIYLAVILALSVPLLIQKALPPARMESAEKVYHLIESLPVGLPDQYALIAADFGPGTQAENQPQAEVVVEHLMRRRIPIIVMTRYALGERFAVELAGRVAKRLEVELPGEKWVYGEDWITLGFKPSGGLFVQAFAQSENLIEYLAKDFSGNPLSSFPRFSQLKTLKNIGFVAEFTGLTGMLGDYIQYLQRADYVPPLVHGCTSITIPEAYIYIDSGQLRGALEGIAGAAWYSELLKDVHPGREVDDALLINTALGVAHLAIIALVILGNVVAFLSRRTSGGAHG